MPTAYRYHLKPYLISYIVIESVLSVHSIGTTIIYVSLSHNTRYMYIHKNRNTGAAISVYDSDSTIAFVSLMISLSLARATIR